MSDTIKVYKGFDANWKCRDFQYEVGKSYTYDGVAKLCSEGFHACEYPLDIFNYYPPTGQIAECELSGLDEKTDNDSKRAGNFISIKASISIPMLVSAAVEFIKNKCEPSKEIHSTGDYSAASNTGFQSAASNTGDYSAASNTGKNGIAAVFGLNSKAKANKTGIIIVAWMDGKQKRVSIGYVGENNILENTWYSVDNKGNFIKVD